MAVILEVAQDQGPRNAEPLDRRVGKRIVDRDPAVGVPRDLGLPPDLGEAQARGRRAPWSIARRRTASRPRRTRAWRRSAGQRRRRDQRLVEMRLNHVEMAVGQPDRRPGGQTSRHGCARRPPQPAARRCKPASLRIARGLSHSCFISGAARGGPVANKRRRPRCNPRAAHRGRETRRSSPCGLPRRAIWLGGSPACSSDKSLQATMHTAKPRAPRARRGIDAPASQPRMALTAPQM